MFYCRVLSIICIFLGCSVYANSALVQRHSKLQTITPNDQGLYDQAMNLLMHKKFTQAIVKLKEIVVIYPFSLLTPHAELLCAQISYLAKDYVNTILYSKQYIAHHPYSEYAYYLNALAYYRQIGYLERSSVILLQARESFTRLLKLFPHSLYANSARVKLREVTYKIVHNEMSISRFYLQRGIYIAAITRFINILHTYNEKEIDIYLPEIFYRLAIAYNALGLTKEAIYYRNNLHRRFAESVWNKYL